MKDVSYRRMAAERPWYEPAEALIENLQPEKVLDLGTGAGEFALRLRQKGIPKVFVSDGSGRYVTQAKRKGFPAKRADFDKKLPYRKETFDLVVTLEVIEHLQNAELFVSEIARILKKGGYLLISTPNVSFIGVRVQSLIGLPPPDEGYHFRFFNAKTLRELLKNNGFRVIKSHPIFFLPFYKLTGKNPKARRVLCCENLFASKLILLCQKS